MRRGARRSGAARYGAAAHGKTRHDKARQGTNIVMPLTLTTPDGGSPGSDTLKYRIARKQLLDND